MKRIVRGLGTVVVGTVLLGLGVAWARPSWLPAWAQFDLDRLPSWARLGGPRSGEGDQEADGDEERVAPRAAVPAELIDDGWCDAEQKRRVQSRTRTRKATKTAPSKECRRLLPVVRLASPDLAHRIGLETAEVTRQRHAHRLLCNAETAYDARRSAEIIPRVAGVLREVRVDLGQYVRQGEVLAIVDSALVGAAKAQYLTALSAFDLARVTYERTRKLTQAKAAPGKTEVQDLAALNQAKTGLLDAEQKLHNLGFGDADLERIARESDTKDLLPIVAPLDGTIIVWDATRGEAVEPTTQLFGMADTSRMSLWIDVYESDIVQVAPHQAVTFTISGTDEPVFTGKVTWMGTEVNTMTRTTRVRAELANPDGRLRANQFGRATIQVEPEHDALVVPRAAVQSDGQADLVFLALTDDRFRPQRVRSKPTEADDIVEITWGLSPGQRVVTTRSFMLKTELFKDQLGAADND